MVESMLREACCGTSQDRAARGVEQLTRFLSIKIAGKTFSTDGYLRDPQHGLLHLLEEQLAYARSAGTR